MKLMMDPLVKSRRNEYFDVHCAGWLNVELSQLQRLSRTETPHDVKVGWFAGMTWFGAPRREKPTLMGVLRA
jgi:hypothetical protein